MPAKRKISRTLKWKWSKKRKGLCQWCGREPARLVTFLDGRRRRGALCERCDNKRKNAAAFKLASKTAVDSALAKS